MIGGSMNCNIITGNSRNITSYEGVPICIGGEIYISESFIEKDYLNMIECRRCDSGYIKSDDEEECNNLKLTSNYKVIKHGYQINHSGSLTCFIYCEPM